MAACKSKPWCLWLKQYSKHNQIKTERSVTKLLHSILKGFDSIRYKVYLCVQVLWHIEMGPTDAAVLSAAPWLMLTSSNMQPHVEAVTVVPRGQCCQIWLTRSSLVATNLPNCNNSSPVFYCGCLVFRPSDDCRTSQMSHRVSRLLNPALCHAQ